MAVPEEVLTADICIVGAGVAGVSVARRLSAKGISTILVESGNTDESPHDRDLSKGEHTGMPYWSLESTRCRRFGGSASIWFLELLDGRPGLRLRPLDRIDFEAREGMPRTGWPISLDDIQPYYRQAESLFDVASGEPWDPEPDDTMMAYEAPELRSINFRISPSELFTDTYYSELRQSPNVQVCLDTTVMFLVTSDGSTIDAAIARRPDGSMLTLKAQRFVLAGGGIEIPRLLLLSELENNCVIGTASDNIGRYFMEHPHFVSGVIVPEDDRWFTDSRYGRHDYNGTTQITKITLSEHVIKSAELPNFCVNLSVPTIDDREIRQSKAYDALRILRSYSVSGRLPVKKWSYLADVVTGLPDLTVKAAKTAVSGLRPNGSLKHFDLYYMSEQSPNRESRVLLGSEKDGFGQPRARLHWDLVESDIRDVLRGQEILDRTLREAGAGVVIPDEFHEMPPPGIRGGYHHMGTTRMSASPADGVVDRNCKVHGTTNLYVAGSSVFTTCGFANPTFTIGALALRLADHLSS